MVNLDSIAIFTSQDPLKTMVHLSTIVLFYSPLKSIQLRLRPPVPLNPSNYTAWATSLQPFSL